MLFNLINRSKEIKVVPLRLEFSHEAGLFYFKFHVKIRVLL